MQVSSNPSSKWLDRLRRSKGFPDGGADQDLDHFLSLQKTHFPNSPIPNSQIGKKQNPNSIELDREPSSFLYDLFNFGKSSDDPGLVRKKGIRKQEKPRFCEVSNRAENEVSVLMREENGDVGKSSDDPGLVRKKGIRKQEKPRFYEVSGFGGLAEANEVSVLMREENGDGDEKGGGCDFVGFSRTNVTVIDTSYPWWKCERVVFRKKNLWRVRDRKSKGANSGGNKRKTKSSGDENDGSRKVPKLCGSSDEGNKQNEKTNQTPEDFPDTYNQVQNQRFPRKSKKVGSDCMLVKRTLTSNKNGLVPLRIDGS